MSSTDLPAFSAPRPVRGLTRTRDPQKTREDILRATIEVMREQGSHNLRIADVATRAGVTTGAIYGHFTDRNGLIAAAHILTMREAVGMIMEAFDSGAGQFDGNAMKDPIYREYAREYFSREGRHERLEWMEAVLMAYHEPDLADAIAPLARQVMDRMVQTEDKLKEAGIRRSDLDSRVMAMMLFGITLGSTVLWPIFGDDDPELVDKFMEAWPYMLTAFDVDRPMSSDPDVLG